MVLSENKQTNKQTNRTELLYIPAVPLLSIDSREAFSHTHNETFTEISTAALFMERKKVKGT